MDLVIRNGTVVTSATTVQADIGISDGHIVSISERIDADGAQTIDASGRLVMPGAVDPHTHFDMPWTLGGESEEVIRAADDFRSGTIAAAFGGITTVIDYCLVDPGSSLAQGLENWHGKARGKALVDYGFHIILTDWSAATMREVPDIIEAGCPSFKIFMPYAIGASDEQLLETFDVAAQNGAITLVHCESAAAIDYLSRVYAAKGELGIPSHYRCHSPGVEGEATARAAHLAALVDAPFYNVHMSSAESLEEIRRARAKEQPVYAETCPHFLTLTRELLDLPTTEAVKYVCTPALRERPHLNAMWGGIRSGDISVLASDYACWNLKDKRRGIDDFRTLVHGFGGIELMIPLIYSEGVAKQRISLSKFVAITSTNAAKIFGLYPRKGEIMPGADADVMIFDPEARTIIKCEDLHQGVDYNAWEGWEVTGWPTTVLSRGSVIVDNGELRASPGRGRFVRRDKFRRPDL